MRRMREHETAPSAQMIIGNGRSRGARTGIAFPARIAQAPLWAPPRLMLPMRVSASPRSAATRLDFAAPVGAAR